MFPSAVIRKIVPIIGCLLFLGSIVFPFLNCSYVPLIVAEYHHSRESQLWSFRCHDTRYYSWLGPHLDVVTEEEWFYYYWFHDDFIVESGLSWTLMFLFIIQIFTLTTEAASLSINKRIFALMPAILCPIVIGLMIYTYVRLHEISWGLNIYLQGYWLTYPSEALFITNFLLKRKIR